MGRFPPQIALLDRNNATLRRLTGHILRGVSTNVHKETGLRWRPNRRVNDDPPLGLRPGERFKTVLKKER